MPAALREGSEFAGEDFDRILRHKAFRPAVRAYAAANLALYASLDPIERWLVSDLGRWSLTSAALVLDALGGLTGGRLAAGAAANRTCSEGRVRAYIRCALAHGLLAPGLSNGELLPTTRLTSVTGAFTRNLLLAVSAVAPEVSCTPACVQDDVFRRRFYAAIGLHTVARPDLFAGPDRPVLLFLGRDGGARILEHLVARQEVDGGRLFEQATASQSALAKCSHVSRTHVSRLLAAGVAGGLLSVEGRSIKASPELAADVERHFALVMEMARVCALAGLRA